MQKTLTLRASYITSDSGLSGVLNGGEDWRTFKANSSIDIGTIAFNTSALNRLSKACVLNMFNITFQQKCDYDTLFDRELRWEYTPRKITGYSIDGNTIAVTSATEIAGKSESRTSGNDYLSMSRTLFNGALPCGENVLYGFYLKGVSEATTGYKLYLKDLSASFTYTAKYYATFYDDDGTLIETKTVDGGVSATAPTVQREGFSVVWSCDGKGGTWLNGNLPSSESTDLVFRAVYRPIPRVLGVKDTQKGEVKVFEYNNGWEEKSPTSRENGITFYTFNYGDKVKITADGCNTLSEDLVVAKKTTTGTVISTETISGSASTTLDLMTVNSLTDSFIFEVTPTLAYFTITTIGGENGDITPTHMVTRYTDDAITIRPNVGCSVYSVEIDGVAIEVDPSGMVVPLTNVSANMTIEAAFTNVMYDITFDVDEGVTVTGPQSVAYGMTGTWVITCGNDASLVSLSVDDGENTLGTVFKQLKENEFSLDFVTEPHTVHVRLTDDLATVTIEQTTGGTVACDLIENNSWKFVKDAGELTFIATPDAYYAVDSWYNSAVEDSITVAITGDLTVYADFAPATIEIDTELECEEEIPFIFEKQVNGGWIPWSKYCNVGDTIRVKMGVPESEPYAPDYTPGSTNLEYWGYSNPEFTATTTPLGEESEITQGQGSVVFTVLGETEVMSVVALKTVQGPARTIGEAHGSVVYSVSPNAGDKYKYKTELYVTPAPDPGYEFIGWYTNIIDGAVPKNVLLTTQERLQYVIPYMKMGGKLLAMFEINGRKYSRGPVFAKFRIIDYKINVTAGFGGTATGGGSFHYGDKCVVNIYANYGYKVKDVLMDGESVIGSVTVTRRGGTLVFQSVSESHDIEVIFGLRMYQSNRLLDYYPPVIASILDIQRLMDVLQVTDDALWDSASFIMENQFVDTATLEGVTMWERELGIVPAPNDTFEQRKARLKLKWVPNNRFTIRWLHKWLEDVCGTKIKKPVVHEKDDYILTVTLPWFVQWIELFKDLDMYKPANIELDPIVTLPAKDIVLLTGFAYKTKSTYTVDGSSD